MVGKNNITLRNSQEITNLSHNSQEFIIDKNSLSSDSNSREYNTISQESNSQEPNLDSVETKKSSGTSDFNNSILIDEDTTDLGISLLQTEREVDDKENVKTKMDKSEEVKDVVDDNNGEKENCKENNMDKQNKWTETSQISSENRKYRTLSESSVNNDWTTSENDSDSSLKKGLKRKSSINLDSINRIKRKSVVNNAPNYFDIVSDEVILMIFSYLNKKSLIECSQVCKRFKRISYTEMFWTRIDVSSKVLNTVSIDSLLDRNPKLLRMSQTQLSSVNFKQKFLRTEYLDLSMAKINNDTDLELFLKHFDSLKKLSMENVCCNYDVMNSISQNEELNCLNLTMCKHVCQHGLKLLLTKCKGIISLNLAWTNLNKKAIDVLCEYINPNIQYLNLSGCLKNLNNDHIEALSKTCTKLIELDLSDCTNLTSDVMDIIAFSFPKLTTLSISRCYNIAPGKYTVVLNKNSLKYLNIFGLLHNKQVEILQAKFSSIRINENKFSYIARPTVHDKRTSIWGHRVRDPVVDSIKN